MKGFILFLLGVSLVAFQNCGGTAFSGDDSVFAGKLDGQSIEVVTEEEAAELSMDLNDQAPAISTNDEGISGDEEMGEEMGEEPRNRGRRNNRRVTNIDPDSDRPRASEERKCMTPREVMRNREIEGRIGCGDKEHKVVVCHHPGGDETKKHTQCIAKRAMENQLARREIDGIPHQFFLGACENDPYVGGDEDDEEEGDE